ncbi:AT-hook motif nuclear-localized protein 9-like [Cynara cardunculus var. scolymus]|uniref:AT-hook motif nuclear-localized protein 9-like n=1 Tax=Cynara cardunculus var. scolymus TaxID=59895 RepID=UPI000D62D81E|nr:AT-hook motif nuclear-localized protein 9-like [Cynara cardunculus var. scolymus]
MKGGGSKVYQNTASEFGFEASNIGMEGSDVAITTRRSTITSDGSGCGFATPLKRKRGRPRKYDSHGNFIRRPSAQSPSPLPIHQQPLGSAHHQLHAMGQDMHGDTEGMELTPYVIQVCTGEDVAEKIIAPFQIGPRCISVLSAIGMVYNVVIRQPDSSSYAHLLKYEGIFEILRLSGTFNISEDGKIQTGGLSVLLSRTDGHIIGGTLGGSLLASTPVQMVVGSFIPTRKQKLPKKRNLYGLRMRVSPHVGLDPKVGTSENPISQAPPVHKLQVTSHEPAPTTGMKTNDGGTSYTKHKPRASSLVPSWNLKLSPDLNVDASME